MLVWQGTVIGLGATALFDLWQVLVARAQGQPGPNLAPMGRWFWHLRDGRVFHPDIATAAPWEHELALGWIGHYVVGAIYGVAFLLLAGPGWMAAPTFLPAWAFGVATVAFGWFLLQPGMGMGWAASKTANPVKVRVLNLAAHTVFGLGLWLTALAVG